MADKEKSPAEIQAEFEQTMALAAIKIAVTSFHTGLRADVPEELAQYWANLNTEQWREHLTLFSKELKKIRNPKVREIVFDVDNYVRDCRRLNIEFYRSKEEILLMVAIGQIDVMDFLDVLGAVPSNREKLDRKIEKQIKMLEWEDERDLTRLDELTHELDNPRIKKSEIETIDKEIDHIEKRITNRKVKRDDLAIKLVEWKARGNIDIAGAEGKFRLDA